MTVSKIIIALSFIGFLASGCSNNNYSAQEGEIVENAENKENSESGTEESEENENSETENEGEITFTFSASSNHTLLGGKRQVFNYDAENESLEILIPLPKDLTTVGIEGNLPNHPNVRIDLDIERSALVISTPLKDYLDLVKNPSGLPNGRPLPGVNGGEPPSFGFPLPFNDLDAYGYAALDSVSVYIEFDWKLDFLKATVPIYSDQNQNLRVGQVYLLNAVNGYSAGVFLSLSLPDELSVLIANAQ